MTLFVCALSLGESQVPQGIDRFAFSMFPKVATKKGNLLYSSSSIHQGLALLMAGSRGATLDEFSSVLSLSKDFTFAKEYRDIISYWNSADHPYQILSANALWTQKGITLQADYLKILREDFLSAMNQVDFAAAPDKAKDTINTWVEKQTNSKIKDLLSVEMVPPTTKLILVNAVYFKSAWLNIFDKNSTTREKFFKTKKTTLSVPMMKNEGTYNYLSRGDFDLVELPYRGQDTAMDLIIPRQKFGLNALEKTFTYENFSKWMKDLKFEKVELSLPRFTFKSYFQLKDVLTALGIKSAFGEGDFSGMGQEKFTLSEVVHKSFINVDEFGTEAAAATASVMMSASAPDPKKPKIVKADRPFLFVIRDTEKNVILFVGRVDDPSN